MWPLGRSAFERRLRRLGRERFVAFVAALWEARGYETTVSGDVVTASDGRGERRLWVHHQGWLTRRSRPPPDAPVDAVVSNRPAGPASTPLGDPRVVGLDDLHGMVRYALGERERRALLERFFDRPPDLKRPTGPAVGRAAAPLGALLVLVLAAAGAGMAVMGPTDGGPADGAGPVTEPAPEPTTVPPGPTTATTTAAVEEGTFGSGFPPGLNASGVTDPWALASVHAEVATNRSYTLSLTYRETENGETVGVLREVARVAGPTVYASRIERRGVPVQKDPALIADRTVYADGSTRHVRGGGEERIDLRAGGEGWYADRIESYLAGLLGGFDTTVAEVARRNGRPAYGIELRAKRRAGMRNVSGWMVVDARGFVYSLRVAYTPPEYPERSVAVSIEYDAVGETSVEPPGWYDGSATPPP